VTPPSTTQPDTNSAFPGRIARAVLVMLADEAAALCWWGLLIAGALIGYRVSEGTSYHQLAVGILMSSLILFALLAVFECIWSAINR
jgi:hypothetical protein